MLSNTQHKQPAMRYEREFDLFSRYTRPSIGARRRRARIKNRRARAARKANR